MTADDLRYILAAYQLKTKCTMTTLDNVRRVFSTFFAFLESDEYIKKNPIKKIEKFKKELREKKPFSHEELEKIRMACDNKRDRALIEFLYSTGCRAEETERTNIEDIDFRKGECTVIGKGNKQRTVYLSQIALLHIKNYLEERKNFKDKGPLFMALKGRKRLKESGIEIVCRNLGIKTNIKSHPHKFRRTFATHMLSKGMPINQIQVILGHESIATTTIYAMNNIDQVKASFSKYMG